MVGINNKPTVSFYGSVDEMQNGATQFVADHLRSALTKGVKVSFFLSGGSTPGPVYKNLSRIKLNWSNVIIGQVDDRWVGLKDPGSNAALVKQTLLKNRAASAEFIRIKSAHKTAKSGQGTVEKNYQNLPLKNSIAVLGMGTDGHVCSWFPGSEGLSSALDADNDNLVQAIMANRTNVTGPYLERMTLTLSALKKCGAVLLLISGDEKRAVLKRAMKDQASELPVYHLVKSIGDRLTILHAS